MNKGLQPLACSYQTQERLKELKPLVDSIQEINSY